MSFVVRALSLPLFRIFSQVVCSDFSFCHHLPPSSLFLPSPSALLSPVSWQGEWAAGEASFLSLMCLTLKYVSRISVLTALCLQRSHKLVGKFAPSPLSHARLGSNVAHRLLTCALSSFFSQASVRNLPAARVHEARLPIKFGTHHTKVCTNV